MSVLLVTSAGNLVVDLFHEQCPLASENFLKLCKLKYYNNVLIYNIQKNFMFQSGDPTGTGRGGNSFKGVIAGGTDKNSAPIFLKDETIGTGLRHDREGLLCMANSGRDDSNLSQFYVTLRADNMAHLDGKHTIFGQVVEGFDVLRVLNETYCDSECRPYQDVRIRHTFVLHDPFSEDAYPIPLQVPPSPMQERPTAETVKARIPMEPTAESADADVLDEGMRKKEASSRAVVLEMTGDLPSADVKPPDEVLFVCKLNPVTTDGDLEIIFARFGKVTACNIIRDAMTGESLQYAFVEFATESACVRAYEKMNNVLIDDRRIKVDFSQSVSHLWNKFHRGERAVVKAERPATGRSDGKSYAKSSSSGIAGMKRRRDDSDSQRVRHQQSQHRQQLGHRESGLRYDDRGRNTSDHPGRCDDGGHYRERRRDGSGYRNHNSRERERERDRQRERDRR